MKLKAVHPGPGNGLFPRRRFLAGAIGVALAAPHLRLAGAQAETVRKVLPNGLTVVVDERPSADVVSLQHTALAGVRDDGTSRA